MSMIDWLIELESAGVVALYRDGEFIHYDFDYRHHNARAFRRLEKLGRKQGHVQKAFPMLPRLPKAVSAWV